MKLYRALRGYSCGSLRSERQGPTNICICALQPQLFVWLAALVLGPAATESYMIGVMNRVNLRTCPQS